MIYPKTNKYRNVVNLNGVWHFKAVEDGYCPSASLTDYSLMAVPASMNEVVTDFETQNHVGLCVYEREFSIPVCKDNEYRLRIGATSHRCKVYLNGELIGEGLSGFLPIDLRIESIKDINRLTVVIDNRLTAETLPAGRLKGGKQAIKFDFYNFTGIHRDVLIYSRPIKHINDISVKTVVDGDYRKIKVDVNTNCESVSFDILDRDRKIVASSANSIVMIDEPHLWSPDAPYLYTLVVKTESDVYEERFGIRKIEVDGDRLLLNGKPVYLKGFCMHEDFFILGKGNSSAINIRNFELLKWIGANSIRTSHYPYSEEFMDLADEYGILVIDEVPCVGMNWWDNNFGGADGVNDVTLSLHKKLITDLYARDKNHPCVIMMSVANEAATNEDASDVYFKEVIQHAKNVWDVPVTIVEFYGAEETRASKYVDVLSINRYFGWYYDHGDLSVIKDQMIAELNKWHDIYKKPIILAEFGADTVEGFHSLPAESFSEEFQMGYLSENCKAFDECDFCIGEHVWNFAGFKTKQGINRVKGNRKGVFTRERQPKLAAHFIKQRWSNKK